MNCKLTKKLIDGFEFQDNGKKDIRWDSEMSGFGLRLYPSGKKSFIVSYRQNGTKRLFTLGQYGNITLEQARDLARKKFGEVADGKDPLLLKKAHKKKHEWTVKRAYGEFLKKHAQANNKHWPETNRIFEKDILPAIGKRPIDEVRKEDIIKILDSVTDRKARIMANRTLAAIRKFFNWCVERDIITHSPAYMVAAPSRPKSRDRVLSDQELKEIWQTAENFHYPFGPLVRFLIVTGQRRGEVAAMRWQDYDEKKKLWIIPKDMTKSGRQHEVPLSNLAIQILKSIPNMGDYIFTSSGERPFENFSRDKNELVHKLKTARREKNYAPMPHWTLHDLRRTTASGMAGLGIPPHIVEKLLNHSSGVISGVSAVYNRYEYGKEKKEALDKWAMHIQEILQASDSKSFVGIAKKSN
jgi:integrase